MSDASREADGYEVERSSADQHTAGEHGAESDARCFREWPDRNSVRVHICIGTGEHECYCGVCGPRVIPPAVPATPDAGDARCTCANDGNANRCPHHTQADYEASRDAGEGAHDGHAERLNGLLADCPGCATSEGLSEANVEALAKVHLLGRSYPLGREAAEVIVASDWLAARVSAAATKARAEERERIAQAIEAAGDNITCPEHSIPDCSPLLNGCSTVIRLRARIAVDARIARLAPGTAGGDR